MYQRWNMSGYSLIYRIHKDFLHEKMKVGKVEQLLGNLCDKKECVILLGTLNNLEIMD